MTPSSSRSGSSDVQVRPQRTTRCDRRELDSHPRADPLPPPSAGRWRAGRSAAGGRGLRLPRHADLRRTRAAADPGADAGGHPVSRGPGRRAADDRRLPDAVRDSAQPLAGPAYDRRTEALGQSRVSRPARLVQPRARRRHVCGGDGRGDEPANRGHQRVSEEALGGAGHQQPAGRCELPIGRSKARRASGQHAVAELHRPERRRPLPDLAHDRRVAGATTQPAARPPRTRPAEPAALPRAKPGRWCRQPRRHRHAEAGGSERGRNARRDPAHREAGGLRAAHEHPHRSGGPRYVSCRARQSLHPGAQDRTGGTGTTAAGDGAASRRAPSRHGEAEPGRRERTGAPAERDRQGGAVGRERVPRGPSQ